MLSILKSATKALKTNKLRTILTTGGVVIGISTVIIVMSLGSATESLIVGQLQSFGSNTIFTEVKVPSKKNIDLGEASSMVEGVTITSLKEADALATKEQIPNITGTYSVDMGEEVVTYRNKKRKTSLLATNASYIEIDQSEMAAGRFFTEEENVSLARVVVIGQKIKKELFEGEEPLGKSIRVAGVNFRVIGIMAERGQMMYMDYDKMIYLPLRTAQKLVLGIDYIIYFVSQLADESIADQTAAEVKEIMRQRHNIHIQDGSKDDFRTTTMAEALDMMGSITGGIQILLITLAAISLLVGGVGIMNIMYVIVSERTREIGLRKALGAKHREILLQFLLEAVIITSIGGLLGISFGAALIYLSAFAAKTQGIDLAFGLSLSGVIIAVLTAVSEGIIFGLYPAQKAAKMNAIEALRSE